MYKNNWNIPRNLIQKIKARNIIYSSTEYFHSHSETLLRATLLINFFIHLWKKFFD